MLGVVTHVAPDGAAGDQLGAEPTQRRLLTRYWKSYVARRCRACRPARPCWPTPRPTARRGVLEGLRRNVSAVNDWAVERGPERAFIATSALGYVMPFAVGLGALAMVAACAQTVLFLLCPGRGVRPAPGRGRAPPARALVRFWLAPAGHDRRAGRGVAALLHGRAAAETLHASDEYVGLLLAGSTWPALAAVLIGRWLTRRRRLVWASPRAVGPAAKAPRS